MVCFGSNSPRPKGHTFLSLRRLLRALRFAWCSTPPTANAYTTRSCFARLPARFGYIILSCEVQYEGEKGKGILPAQYRSAQVRITRIRWVLVPCCSSTFKGQYLHGTATILLRKGRRNSRRLLKFTKYVSGPDNY